MIASPKGALLTLAALVPLTFFGCASDRLPMKSYVQVKDEYLAALQASSNWGAGSNYRIVAIPPLVEPYKPGTPIRKGSTEPLTDACLVPSDRLPESADLPEPPASHYSASFDLDLGIPDLLKDAITEVVDIRAAVSTKREAMVSFSDLRHLNARTDTLKIAALNESCLDSIVGVDVLMIRGLIDATEVISNLQRLGADAKVALFKNDSVRVRYDSMGGYEVKETRSKPKFWIVSEWRIDIPGLSPTALPAERLTAIQRYMELSIAGLPLTEQLPSKETVQEYLKKLVPYPPTNLRVE